MHIRLYDEKGDHETYQLLFSASSNVSVATLPEIHRYLYKENLFRDINGHRIVLPQMRLLWRELDDLRGDEIRATLEREAIIEARQPTRMLRLLGSELDGRILNVAAPLIIISVLVYMLTHVRHANRLTVNLEANEVEKLHSFPWIGLYSDKLSLTVLFSVIGILPVVAVASAFYTSLPGLDFRALLDFKVIIHLVLFSAILAMAIRIVRICRSIRAAT